MYLSIFPICLQNNIKIYLWNVPPRLTLGHSLNYYIYSYIFFRILSNVSSFVVPACLCTLLIYSQWISFEQRNNHNSSSSGSNSKTFIKFVPFHLKCLCVQMQMRFSIGNALNFIDHIIEFNDYLKEKCTQTRSMHILCNKAISKLNFMTIEQHQRQNWQRAQRKMLVMVVDGVTLAKNGSQH